MELIDPPAVEKLNALACYARDSITDAIATADVPACVTGAGSMFRVHMKAEAPNNYRESFAGPEETRLLGLMLDHLFENGIIMINTCSATLSTPMTETKIDTLAEALLGGFRKLRSQWL
jgi:glutamate-1-semialdehyde 2,1-aminomutase